jgi:hypothetical protein
MLQSTIPIALRWTNSKVTATPTRPTTLVRPLKEKKLSTYYKTRHNTQAGGKFRNNSNKVNSQVVKAKTRYWAAEMGASMR